ncbi:rhamnan synthesis F family protein [uncultured Roseobacter sp.]|uniref:rhamnan synthesis F family protein n=1 Tax=uncultured Roseobacter sp. TaxID=114847 RepID=UPI0026221D58|nr:rhamnan synthesis F family protein [uncultured Roseobacter sp.]
MSEENDKKPTKGSATADEQIQSLLTWRTQVLQELSQTAAELERLREGSRDLESLYRDLADARDRPWKSFKRKQLSRLLYWLSGKDRLLSERRRDKFLSSAQKRDPKRSLRHLSEASLRDNSISDERADRPPGSKEADALASARSKKAKFGSSVMVVSHDATRTGAPILALNLVKELSNRHNVVSVILGGGDLARDFAAESVELLELNRLSMQQEKITRKVADLCAKHNVSMGFVNSVESRSALPGLKSAGVPSVALLHEFAAYTRPMSAFPDVFAYADQVVFSADITLENALAQPGSERPVNVHVLPQGKCETGSSDKAPAKTELAWLDSVLRPSGPQDDTFVVIGAGTIETRKGIDLFIEVANRIISGPGGGRFRFIWFGHGYDPVKDTHRSVYLADQIERAGIQTQMKIVRATTEIEHVYRTADLMLLSSRLDPLPNVAIDMLVADKPLVCFERTTGIAALLDSAGLKEACVASFLDTAEMADKIRALADDPELLTEVLKKSKKLARKAFDFTSYAQQLEKLATSGGTKVESIARDATRLKDSGAFRSDFFGAPGKKRISEAQNIENYLVANKSGTHLRKPAPGFNQLIFAEENGWGKAEDPFVAFIEAGQPTGRWKSDVIDETSPIDADVLGDQKVALHIHAFFPNELENILSRLTANQTRPSLFVSAPKTLLDDVKGVLASYDGPVEALRSVPNRGRDIAPFLTEFGREMVTDFDILGHLHTKKSNEIQDRKTVENWVEFLMENTLGGPRAGAMLDRIVTAMTRSQDLGIVYPDDPHLIGWANNKAIADQIAKRMGITDLPRHINYPMGTMFWARAALVEKFLSLGLEWDDYPSEPIPSDGSPLHAIERMFGVAPDHFGFRTGVTNVHGLTR